MTKPAYAVRAFGQTMWLDEISRAMLTSGEFVRLVEEEGVRGVTANPTIFARAITQSDDYDDAVRILAAEGRDAATIFEQSEIHDLAYASTILRPYFNRSGGMDGFVSIEVSPELADDAEATVVAVRRLWSELDRPNVLVKIPATRAGLPAIQAMLAEGININITLLFSVDRYAAVMEAYLSALEQRVAAGQPIDHICSVASFFVSRVDTTVDRLIDERKRTASAMDQELLAKLRSTAAIANARVAYQRFKETFAGPRWEALREHGAACQRALWASLSTKDPSLPDTYYVDALIGPHTVATVPSQTLLAFNDHGTVGPTLEAQTLEAETTRARLGQIGIDLDAITDRLEAEGVRAFADSYAQALAGIERKIPARA